MTDLQPSPRKTDNLEDGTKFIELKIPKANGEDREKVMQIKSGSLKLQYLEYYNCHPDSGRLQGWNHHWKG